MIHVAAHDEIRSATVGELQYPSRSGYNTLEVSVGPTRSVAKTTMPRWRSPSLLSAKLPDNVDIFV